MEPIFTLQLKHKINPRIVTVGKYDGVHPCLTCGTTASKVFVHNPHGPAVIGGRIAIQDSDTSFLTMNQGVTAVCAGRLDPNLKRDILCIGTQTNVLAYDVHNNTDLFYKDVPDGVNSLTIGTPRNVGKPTVISGGHCTLQGYDALGTDCFWTVTGDVVCSTTMVDYLNEGHSELVVGSEDNEIRVFKSDELIVQLSETEAITGLCPMGQNARFAYSLANGTVGTYERSSRLWRIKSKNQVIVIHNFDIDGDGVDELITGWSNGKIDVRSQESGDVMFTDNMKSAVAGLVHADYKMHGTDQLIACSVEGELRGYAQDANRTLTDQNKPVNDIKELSVMKQNLLLELQNYEAESEPLVGSQFSSLEKQEGAIIPAGTALNTQLQIGADSRNQACVQLVISTSNETVVRMVVIYAEGLFDGESHVQHPPANAVSGTLEIPLYPSKDVNVDLHVQAFVTLPGSNNFHVFEVTISLPSFSSYLFVDRLRHPVEGQVQFTLQERMKRVAIWVSENFLLPFPLECGENLLINFQALRGGVLSLEMQQSGQVTIRTDDIDLAGNMIQSLCGYLSIDHLQVTAQYPTILEKLTEIMSFIDNLQGVTQKLAAEMTDHANLIKSMVVRAEDARIQENMSGMKKAYVELQAMNNSLVNGYKIRSTNHQELLKSLKFVNQIIQKAAQLRVGKYQTQVITQCREAIKNGQVPTMCKIIQAGSA